MFKQSICGTNCESYLDNLFNSMNEGFILNDVIYDNTENPVGFNILAINESFKRMFNITEKNILGKDIMEVFHDVGPDLLNKFIKVATNLENTKFDIYYEKNEKHFRVSIFNVGKSKIVAMFIDITELIKADAALKIHSILFENANDILLYLKKDGSIVDANKTAIETYGYTREELLNMKLQQLRHPSTLKELKKQMRQSLSTGIVFESIHVKKDGTSFPVEVSSRTINLNNDLIRIHIIRDISERKLADEKIKYLANYDALTGIPNRGFLMEQLEKTFELSKRGDLKFALMLFDMDKFKMINDIYGHNAGDEVLNKIAERLQKAVRKSDIIGRLGGDEFLVIQPLIKNRKEPSMLADRILDIVSNPVEWNNVNLDIHLSIGISIYPDDSTELKGLINCADSAMYSIKQKGGNGYNFHKSQDNSL